MTNSHPKPPRLAEKLLARLAAVHEPIVGDFAEEFAQMVEENGRFQAFTWYYQQLIRSLPALVQLNLTEQYERRWHPMIKALTTRDKLFLVLGILLLIPAALIGTTGILSSAFGMSGPMNSMFDFLQSSPLLAWIVHPVTIMGGLAAAFLLNALPVFQVSMSNQEDRLVGTIAIRKGYVLQLAVISVVSFFVSLIFLYLLAENFGILGL